MKSQAIRYSLIIAVSLLLTLAAMIVVAGASRWSPPSPIPPPPPTPGPPPTAAPYKPEGGEPVRNRDEAIQRALLIESSMAVREQPLTEEVLAANPDMVIVERYATRQEAADVYGFGTWIETEVMSEPVWVVRIKGKVCLRIPGVVTFEEGSDGKVCEEGDGVTYVISQKTGYLLAMSTSAQTRSERLAGD
jgi:hypothetical protein